VIHLIAHLRQRRHDRRRRGFLLDHSGRPTVDTFPTLTNKTTRRGSSRPGR
jgi:hypothetical protein